MAISEEEQQLRDEARIALLQTIKHTAQRIDKHSNLHAKSLLELAEAYAIVTSTEEPSSEANS